MERRVLLGGIAVSAGLIGYTWFTRDTVGEWDECPDCEQVEDISVSTSRGRGWATNAGETRVTITFFEAFTGHVKVEALDRDGEVTESKTVPVEQQTSVEVQFIGTDADDVTVKVNDG